MVIFETEII